MKIVRIEGDMARAEVGGVTRQISLALVENIEVGQYVIVHAGFAIERLREDEAIETLRLLDELADASEMKKNQSDGGAGG